MSEIMDTKQVVEEATAAASLTVDLVELGQASVEMSVSREHTSSLLALVLGVLMAVAAVAGVPFSTVQMASAGLSEWLIIAVAVMEIALLTVISIKVYKFGV